MKESGSIKTPFNIEMILRACPVLLKMWEDNLFYFDIKNGKVVVKYLEDEIRQEKGAK